MNDYENFTERMTSFDLTLTADESQDLALAHYGVKGMKWGVIREKASAARQGRREGRAQKFESKATIAQQGINRFSRKAVTNNPTAQKKVERLTKVRDQALKDAEAKRQGKLSQNEKRALIGAAVVGTLIAAHVGYKAIDSGQARVMLENGKDFLTKNGGERGFKKNDALSKWNMSVDDLESNVVKHINPGYGGLGTKNNCRRATFAYEMRRRGYDVKATKSLSGTGQNTFGVYNALGPKRKDVETMSSTVVSAFRSGASGTPDPKISTITKQLSTPATSLISKNSGGIEKTKEVFSGLAAYPNGARGELNMEWSAGGGHSMAWEIVKGKPVIFDTQTQKTYKNVADFLSVAPNAKEIGALRLDDLPINDEFLRKWVANV